MVVIKRATPYNKIHKWMAHVLLGWFWIISKMYNYFFEEVKMNNAKQRSSAADNASVKARPQFGAGTDIVAVSIETMQKLLQNNIEYSQTVLGSMMQLMQPFSSPRQHQDLLARVIETNTKACQKAQEIITVAMGKCNPNAVVGAKAVFTPPMFNIFNWWTDPAKEAVAPGAVAAPFATPTRVMP